MPPSCLGEQTGVDQAPEPLSGPWHMAACQPRPVLPFPAVCLYTRVHMQGLGYLQFHTFCFASIPSSLPHESMF